MVIYLTTHLPTGKMYIGRDRNNHHRYFGSGVDLKKIIKAEGRGNLKKEILEECSDLKTLNQQEEYWLNYYDVENNPMFLNKTNKAYGCSRQTEEGKRKIKENRTPHVWTKERREYASKQRMGKPLIFTKTRKDAGVKRGITPKISKSLRGKPKPWLRKKVGQYTLDGELVKTYKSAKQAIKETKIKIQNAITGRSKNAGGYIWKYIE